METGTCASSIDGIFEIVFICALPDGYSGRNYSWNSSRIFGMLAGQHLSEDMLMVLKYVHKDVEKICVSAYIL